MTKISKKVFKEKTSIKQELQKALDNKTIITHSILAKSVGISLYRVKKYCKNHAIDLNTYNQQILDTPLKIEKTPKKKKKKMVVLDTPNSNKIILGIPKSIKMQLE